jgi:hypothetical protein
VGNGQCVSNGDLTASAAQEPKFITFPPKYAISDANAAYGWDLIQYRPLGQSEILGKMFLFFRSSEICSLNGGDN